VKSVTVTSLLIAVVLGVFAYEYFSLPDVSTLRKRNPGSTALMELREEESRRRGARVRREQAWVPYDSVSEHLKRAILVSEDAAFFSHNGVDFFELKEAFKKDWPRGNSSAAAAPSRCSWRATST
jgi:monofunctional biosynthetic peptidoglycan transglycosylase